MTVQYLNRRHGPSLAYRCNGGGNDEIPTVLFLGGFRSDMEGTKASFLAESSRLANQTFLRFDYSGHGRSEGRFEDGGISRWKQDALDMIDMTGNVPLILVGSSMGGWIGLLCAKERPERVAGFIGLAAAPDFTRDIMDGMDERQKASLARNGSFTMPVEGGKEWTVTRAFLDDGDANCLLQGDIAIDCPVRLIQGRLDDIVPWQKAETLFRQLRNPDKKLVWREKGDHRLSTADDLAILAETVAELSRKR